MHAEAHDFVRSQLGRLSVLEMGSLNVNGSVRDLFPHWAYLGIDRVPGPGVDVVADAAAFDPPQRFDAVVCCEVLEHAPDWPGIVANAFRLLKPGGLFVGTCAGPDRVPHGCAGGPVGDEHYANVAPAALLATLTAAGFADIHVNTLGADLRWSARRPYNAGAVTFAV